MNISTIRMFLLCSICTCAASASTVVLDTGHTLQRPGVIAADGETEYAYNHRLTNAISTLLRKDGVSVRRTGETKDDISLTDRTRETGDADLFVSIHHDSMAQSWLDKGWGDRLNGYSVFVSQKNPEYPMSLVCAQHVGNALLNHQKTPSLYHATRVKGENRPLIDEKRGIHQFDDLVVLKTAKAPAILIETGVIVNQFEAKRLAQPDVINKIALAISSGIEDCLLKR